jgi:Ca2+-dependent lipid-binding protein
MAKKKSKNKSSKPKSKNKSKNKSNKNKSGKNKSGKNKSSKNKSGKKKSMNKSMKKSKTDRQFNNTLPIDKTTMKIISILIPVVLVTFIVGLSFAKGFDNGKIFDMSIVHFLVTHPAFIFVALFLIIATMYFTYASKMEHWLYYCMGKC